LRILPRFANAYFWTNLRVTFFNITFRFFNSYAVETKNISFPITNLSTFDGTNITPIAGNFLPCLTYNTPPVFAHIDILQQFATPNNTQPTFPADFYVTSTPSLPDILTVYPTDSNLTVEENAQSNFIEPGVYQPLARYIATMDPDGTLVIQGNVQVYPQEVFNVSFHQVRIEGNATFYPHSTVSFTPITIPTKSQPLLEVTGNLEDYANYTIDMSQFKLTLGNKLIVTQAESITNGRSIVIYSHDVKCQDPETNSDSLYLLIESTCYSSGTIYTITAFILIVLVI